MQDPRGEYRAGGMGWQGLEDQTPQMVRKERLVRIALEGLAPGLPLAQIPLILPLLAFPPSGSTVTSLISRDRNLVSQQVHT